MGHGTGVIMVSLLHVSNNYNRPMMTKIIMKNNSNCNILILMLMLSCILYDRFQNLPCKVLVMFIYMFR